MKKIEKISGIRAIRYFMGIGLIIYGLVQRDWFYLIAGFLWNFDDIEIVHWQGKEWADGEKWG
jgi:hypothetical protein